MSSETDWLEGSFPFPMVRKGRGISCRLDTNTIAACVRSEMKSNDSLAVSLRLRLVRRKVSEGEPHNASIDNQVFNGLTMLV